MPVVNSIGTCQEYSFKLQQTKLPLDSAGEATRVTAGGYHPVAWYDHRKWVPCQCLSDRSGRPRGANCQSNLPVAAGQAVVDIGAGSQYAAAERGHPAGRERECKGNFNSGEIGLEQIGGLVQDGVRAALLLAASRGLGGAVEIRQRESGSDQTCIAADQSTPPESHSNRPPPCDHLRSPISPELIMP